MNLVLRFDFEKLRLQNMSSDFFLECVNIIRAYEKILASSLKIIQTNFASPAESSIFFHLSLRRFPKITSHNARHYKNALLHCDTLRQQMADMVIMMLAFPFCL